MSECVLCSGVLEERLLKDIKRDETNYEVLFCRRCKIGSTFPVPTSDELSRLYSAGNYRGTCGKRFNPLVEFFIYLSRHLRRRRIERYMRKGSILDIGCGRGLFLDVMRREGWEVTGAEFDEETALQAAETYRIKVISGSPANWGFPPESFDVITLNHVLEHVRKPGEMISECSRVVRRGGLLVIAVPNISSLQAAAGKGVWFHLDVPYHLHHFSEQGLISLLREYSFEIGTVKRFDIEYNPFGWLQTLLNLSGVRENFLHSLLKISSVRKSELKSSGTRDALLTFMLLPFFVPLSLLLSVSEWLLKKGGTIEVYAIKK